MCANMLSMPLKSIKASDYFQLVRPTYVFLKLTPLTSIRNYNSDKIAKSIASLYKNMLQRVRRYNKKFFFDVPAKVAYYVYMERSCVEFYFIVPDVYLSLFRERIGDTWKGITVTRVDSLPKFSSSSVNYKLTFKKEDALSLETDARTNTLLSSMLNVVDVMQEGDKVGVFYNFLPVSQYSWRSESDRTIEKFKDYKPVDREKLSVGYVTKAGLNIVLEVIDMVMDTVSTVFSSADKKPKRTEGVSAEWSKLLFREARVVGSSTLRKRDASILRAQVVVMSESEDKGRVQNNVHSVCQSFKSISGDNEIIYKRHRAAVDMLRYQLPDVDALAVSPAECQNFIALPGRELLDEHKCIEKVDTYESEVPEDLRKGVMSIGYNMYRGVRQSAYLTTDREYRNLALVIVGPTRAGKSTLIANLARDAVSSGECVILFDYCGNTELSSEVAAVFPAQSVLNIDCSNEETLQGLGYNEIVNSANDTVFLAYRNAKIQTSQLLTLVNSINASDKELSAKMDRYLESAALVVFISGGSIKDVFATLQNHEVRGKFVRKIPKDQAENFDEYVSSLKELDDVDKKTGEVSGTRMSAVVGIIDRINKLKQNTYMELMLKKGSNGNIDLSQEIQKAQLICLRMPEVMFTTESEKDIYCTYWMTKLWLSLQIRKWALADTGSHVKVNVVVDELYQVPSAQDFIRSKLSQMAKFTCKMIISCHYLGQIGIIRNELKAANSSYMLISGCDKDNYNELKHELAPYELDDLLALKRFHSLNLIKCPAGYASFITALPKPVR